MSSTTENSKRIAKNSFLLYIRMLFMLIISLYTSRVVLNTLGVVDYGIYNVVGGVIAMLNFLTNSLGVASSRYITYDLGKGDITVMKKTIGNILCIHYLLALIIFLLGESIGLWFMETQLQIPVERQHAAFWVYQFSIFTSVLSVIAIPYNAMIIAHEKMSAFAYISILDALLKLGMVYLLLVIPYDKLIIYAFLYFCIQAFDRIIYGIYCKRHFEESHAKIAYNKNLFRNIFSFAGWIMSGSLAVMGFTQGLNILLNIFFGPVVNAARGIAVQVQIVSQQFCNNFQMALNPQLTKSYARGDLDYMHKLLIKSSKFSFYILLFIIIPLMLEADLVLHWWLGIVPEKTTIFLRLVLCTSLLATLSNPIVESVHASGIIKRFQLIEASLLLTIVPISYLLLKLFHVAPEFVFVVHIVIEIITQYVRLKIILPIIHMDLKNYIRLVLKPIIIVCILAPILPIIVYQNMSLSDIPSFLIVCTISVLSSIIIIYSIGCTEAERSFLKNILYTKILKRQ